MKKVMVIGINPEYNYPGDIHVWNNDTTKYASNLGASMVTRTLLEMFDADYINNFDKIDEYRQQYELCVLAFTNHATDWRDVSIYADFIEKLNIPTSLFSLGIQDYSNDAGSVGPLHYSLKRILNFVSKTTGYIGVRGFYTASLLYKEGYNNVIPIGCPTMYKGMNREHQITIPHNFKKSTFVFHRTFADVSTKVLKNVKLLGQDFLDEAVFTKNHPKDDLIEIELKKFKDHKYGSEMLNLINKNGIFHNNYDDWFLEIGNSDFVFGPRLHGCISGIIQGVPSLLTARDLRVKEIASFFKIPVINYEDFKNDTLQELYEELDYSKFNELYPQRYDNFIGFLTKTNIISYYQGKDKAKDIYFNFHDLQDHRICLYQKIDNLDKKVNEINSRLLRTEKKLKLKKNIFSRIKNKVSKKFKYT